MLVSELIKKLQKAQEKYGDQQVAIESKDDVLIDNVFIVEEKWKNGIELYHIRLTDADEDWIKDMYWCEDVEVSVIKI